MADPNGRDIPRDYRVIVVGSGISGLFVALEARHLGPVLVLTKGSIEDCNTRWAQGGIAAAVGPLDSPERHLEDTIAAGAGLVDELAARVLCMEAPARIADLVEYGVSFDSLGGVVALGREAAHSRSRVLHAGGDRTGAEIETALSAAARLPGISVLDHTVTTRILIEGAAGGVEALDLRTGAFEQFRAPAVVLATGGAGQLYSHTTNPDIATGDGLALAFEAGAELADLEFYQFHPTAFRKDGAPPFLISEAVRGEGAVLRNRAGEAFMRRHHELADLAPRDVVARAIVAEMRREGGDHVVLDCTGLDRIDVAARFPGIYAFCRGQGIDIRFDPIPVAPAAHYFMGGVRTDTSGRTTVPGLYACGEVACTGVHGANRLASNSLMETVVFGKRVVESLAAGQTAAALPGADVLEVSDGEAPAPTLAALQSLMWDGAGIVRTAEGLEGALAVASTWSDSEPPATREGFERRNAALVARLMLAAALRRTESRGAHYRSDYPARDDVTWRRRQVMRRAD
jgi:L-aspartate oxidase